MSIATQCNSTQLSQECTANVQSLINEHKLPQTFIETVETWYWPIAKKLAQLKAAKGKTFYLAINGSQGSGKSTMAAFLQCILQQQFSMKVANLSIDDFYLTRKERQHLAKHIHPLLATRGVPGTHDINLALDTLKKLGERHNSVPLVRFNKAYDDRAEADLWDQMSSPADIVILEGWCMGIKAQDSADLYTPINQLEQEEDCNGRWRNYVNEQLAVHYQDLFSLFDQLIMLKAPSFECVYRWRQNQEDKLRAKQSTRFTMTEAELKRFIQHYQRLTEHALATLPEHAQLVIHLNEQQQFIQATGPQYEIS
ncbi:hypothetical protein [Catenovulum agarivorans]|nr:hypothetical protein [Catenovulum agarivorans]